MYLDKSGCEVVAGDIVMSRGHFSLTDPGFNAACVLERFDNGFVKIESFQCSVQNNNVVVLRKQKRTIEPKELQVITEQIKHKNEAFYQAINETYFSVIKESMVEAKKVVRYIVAWDSELNQTEVLMADDMSQHRTALCLSKLLIALLKTRLNVSHPNSDMLSFGVNNNNSRISVYDKSTHSFNLVTDVFGDKIYTAEGYWNANPHVYLTQDEMEQQFGSLLGP